MTKTERAIILGISTEVGEVGAEITLATLVSQDMIGVATAMNGLIDCGLIVSVDDEHFPTASAIRLAYGVQA